MRAGPHTYVDGGRRLGDVADALRAAGYELGEPHRERRTVLDTFDGRLLDAGLRLEHRDGAASELVLSGGRTGSAHLACAEPPRTAADLAPGALRGRLERTVEVRALLPVSRFEALATPVRRHNGEGKVTASATIYDAPARGDEPLDVTWMVEVAPLDGYDKGTRRLGDLLDRLGALRQPGDAVATTGLPEPPGHGIASPTIPLDPAMPAVDGFRRVLAHLATTIDANRHGTIDDVDPEFLHDLRVAVRRTRSVLSNAGGVLPADVRTAARESFRWLGGVTGPVRDLDVYQLEWRDYVRDLAPLVRDALDEVRSHLAVQRRDAHAWLAAELGGDRMTELLAGWRRWIETPMEGTSSVERAALHPMANVARRRIERAHGRLIEAGRLVEVHSPAAEVHELRKDAKQLRYLLECFGGAFDADARKRFVRRLKTLQDELGAHQDADVHAAHLRAVTSELAPRLPAATMLAAGQLVEQLDRRRAASRAAYASWFGDFDSKATRRALAELLTSSP